ncbi:MAG: hypothetical protein ACYCX4_12565 [Bacillota bacterium]
MAINKWKIFGYTVITWLGLSILAKGYQSVMGYDILSAQSVIWSWASLIMGFVSSSKLGGWVNLLWGLLFFVLALIPGIGILAGIFYFAMCYTKFQRKQSNDAINHRNINQSEQDKNTHI